MNSSMDKRQGVIESINRDLDRVLGAKGFIRPLLPYKDPDLDYILRISQSFGVWTRNSTWKSEIVLFAYTYDTRRDILINLFVAISIPEFGEVQIDCESVADLSGRPSQHRFPILPFRCFVSRRSKIVATDVERAISWFDSYSSPQKCLERLSSVERTGVGVGTDTFRRVTETLTDLVKTGVST